MKIINIVSTENCFQSSKLLIQLKYDAVKLGNHFLHFYMSILYNNLYFLIFMVRMREEFFYMILVSFVLS